MKAVVLTKFGEPPEALCVTDEVPPTPGPGEVRVRMLASPINPSDLSTIRGTYSRLPKLPAFPGYEGVGVVDQAGSGILGRLLVGRRVAFLSAEGGSWREYNVVPARQAVPLSARIPTEQAASFFVNPMTAYALTREVLRVPRGGWMLQSAAASALGRMVIRLGRRYGFHTINIVRRRDQVAELQSLGADKVIVASGSDISDAIREATSQKGVSHAIDCVSGDVGSAMVRGLSPRGRLVVFGTMSGQPLSFSSRDLMTPGARIEGFWLGNFMASLGLMHKIRLVRTVGRLIADGVLATEIGGQFPIDAIHEAIREVEAPERNGKFLLRMNPT